MTRQPDTSGAAVILGEVVAAAPDARRPQIRWAAELGNDLDEVAIQRLIAGDNAVPVTAFERREAVRRLRLRGCTYTEIAVYLDMQPRQVGRDLRRLGISERRCFQGEGAEVIDREWHKGSCPSLSDSTADNC